VCWSKSYINVKQTRALLVSNLDQAQVKYKIYLQVKHNNYQIFISIVYYMNVNTNVSYELLSVILYSTLVKIWVNLTHLIKLAQLFQKIPPLRSQIDSLTYKWVIETLMPSHQVSQIDPFFSQCNDVNSEICTSYLVYSTSKSNL